MTKEEKRLQQLIAGARKHKAQKDKGNLALLLYLTDLEKKEKQFLLGQGYTTFAQFLKTHDLAKPAEYKKFAAGLDVIGVKRAKALGAEAVMAFGEKKVDPTKIDDCIDLLLLHIQEKLSMPSLSLARRLITQVDPNVNGFRHGRGVSRTAELEAENTRLRVRVHQLEKRVAELEAENATLQKGQRKARKAA